MIRPIRYSYGNYEKMTFLISIECFVHIITWNPQYKFSFLEFYAKNIFTIIQSVKILEFDEKFHVRIFIGGSCFKNHILLISTSPQGFNDAISSYLVCTLHSVFQPMNVFLRPFIRCLPYLGSLLSLLLLITHN